MLNSSTTQLAHGRSRDPLVDASSNAAGLPDAELVSMKLSSTRVDEPDGERLLLNREEPEELRSGQG